MSRERYREQLVEILKRNLFDEYEYQALEETADEVMTLFGDDSVRIDFLQACFDEKRYTGKARLRLSTTDRGWRLHETKSRDGTASVREAIDKVIEEQSEAALQDEQGEDMP